MERALRRCLRSGRACAPRWPKPRPGCILMETISNPLLRVGADRPHRRNRPRSRRGAGRGQHLRHAAARAAARTGRALQRAQRHQVPGRPRRRAGRRRGHRSRRTSKRCARSRAPSARCSGPFESYLTMRGIKTFPLRMERQCANACRVASWLAAHPSGGARLFPGDPAHPDAAAIRRLFPPNLYGAMVSFEIQGRRPGRSLPLHGRAAA